MKKTIILLLLSITLIFTTMCSPQVTEDSTEESKDNKEETEYNLSGEIELGKSIDQVNSILGQATDIVESEYGFDWHLFAEDYNNYVQVGVEEGNVVALYTESGEYDFTNGYIGSTKTDIRNELGSPDEYILKGNTQYQYISTDEVDHYNSGDIYRRFFYDKHEDDKAYGVMIIDKDTELSLEGFHGNLNEEVREGFELQLFHLVNATRHRSDKPVLIWSEKASQAAYLHSKDMAENNYFSHQGLDGSDPSERMQEQNIRATMYAENLAANQNAIYSHNGLFNSLGHRKNILGDTEYLGVGTYFIESGNYKMYHTQNFYK